MQYICSQGKVSFSFKSPCQGSYKEGLLCFIEAQRTAVVEVPEVMNSINRETQVTDRVVISDKVDTSDQVDTSDRVDTEDKVDTQGRVNNADKADTVA
ncbi:hypothetical protein BDB01DRAFT_850645 [Pilobolus umbonatus]|nr:hypothetical protein BDB01DRAFT_850645 [Pilobolus umbonatus]